jgi:hypothetical protein
MSPAPLDCGDERAPHCRISRDSHVTVGNEPRAKA